MKKYVSLMPLPLALLLAACQPSPKVGGPCSYVELDENASVTEIQQSFVQLSNEYSHYKVDPDLFASPPIVGDRYKVNLSKISQGTCTPININSVELIGQQ